MRPLEREAILLVPKFLLLKQYCVADTYMQHSQGEQKRMQNYEDSRNLFRISGKREQGKLTEGFPRALVNKIPPTLRLYSIFSTIYFLLLR